MAESREDHQQLLDLVQKELYLEGWWCGYCDYEEGPCDECNRMLYNTALSIFAAINEWAEDATHIDVNGWHRVKVEPTNAVMYHAFGDVHVGWCHTGDERDGTDVPLYTVHERGTDS